MLTTIDSFPLIQAPPLTKETWLMHGFGLKDIPIEKYFEALRANNVVIPQTKQVHGNRVHIFRTKDEVHSPSSIVHSPIPADAFVTSDSNIVCWVRTADCLPILLADVKHRVVGAVHAGWRGTAQKLVLEVLREMKNRWGTDPKDLKAALGPSIGGRCYPVGMDVVETLKKARLFPAPFVEGGEKEKWFFDIAYANLSMLEEAGVPREKIYLSLACTACDSVKFASFRREGKKRGEQVSWILKK